MLTVHLLASKQTYARLCLILFKTNQMYTGELFKETAISGHPQSDQLRSDKPDGEPGTHITTNISDRQSQMVEGNLSLNSPNFFAGNPLHDVYCCTKCKPMDESGIWSILTVLYSM